MKKSAIILFIILIPAVLKAQQIFGVRSLSEGAYPEMRWAQKGRVDSASFTVYRAHTGSIDYNQIKTIQFISFSHDSVFYRVIDTTLTTKGLFQYFIETTSGGMPIRSEILFGHNLGYIPAPAVVNFTAHAVKEFKALQLNWKLSNTLTVKSISLFRSTSYDKDYSLIATLPAEAVSYTDNITRANEPYFYFILINDFFGYQIPSVRIHGISDYAEIPYPPQQFTAKLSGKVVTFTWKGVGSDIIGYRLYRSAGAGHKYFPVNQRIPYTGENTTVTDTITETDKSPLYYYAVSVSDGYLESNTTDTIAIDLSRFKPVSPPAEADFTLDSTGRVMLMWTSQISNPAIKGYNVYRETSEKAFEKINRNLVPVAFNFFTDESLTGYGLFRYAIEAVNDAGEKSVVRTYVDVNRPAPVIHLVISAVQTATGIELSWQPLGEISIKKLAFYRQTGESEPVLAGKADNISSKFTDTRFTPGSTALYFVVAEPMQGEPFVVNDGILVNTEKIAK